MEHIRDALTDALDPFTAKPIPTRFDGITFRSRLEARWAVFFCEIGVQYAYEYEGFELPSGRYVPDFWLPKLGAWLELKPVEPSTIELRLCEELAEMTRNSVYLAAGLPQEASGIWAFRAATDGSVWEDSEYAVCECLRCGAIGIEHMGRSHRVCAQRCYPLEDRGAFGFSPRLRDAYETAIRARFWDPN